MSTTRRRLGIAGAVVGVGAAGVGAAVAVRRYAVGRARLRPDPEAGEPFGGLRGRPVRVTASDGVALYVEIDDAGDPAEGAGAPGRPGTPGRPGEPGKFGRLRSVGLLGRRRHGRASAPAPLTVVFCHGYALNQDSWHYQRRYLRESLPGAAGAAVTEGAKAAEVTDVTEVTEVIEVTELARLVFWDQRGHGRSARGEPGRATIDQLGDDLHAVLRETVPPGAPVVLVGHSMGGMTIMALAEQCPELFGEQVVGVALIGTAAGDVRGFTLGLPRVLGSVVGTTAPGVVRTLGRRPRLVERARRLGGDLIGDFTFLATRRFGFVDPEVSPAVVDFVDRMIQSTPIDVIADFYAALMNHDKRDALATLGAVPTLVLTGDRDGLIPPSRAEEIAAAVPGAELVEVPDCGHLPILERPETVHGALSRLLARAAGTHRPPAERTA